MSDDEASCNPKMNFITKTEIKFDHVLPDMTPYISINFQFVVFLNSNLFKHFCYKTKNNNGNEK